MECMKASSSVQQPHKIVGTKDVLLYCNEEIYDETDEQGETYTVYRYDFYRFTNAEYQNLKAGILPEGAVWDVELRRIERSGLLDEADIRINEANDYMATAETDEEAQAWETYRNNLRAYKMAVRDTVNRKKFPKGPFSYPDLPTPPE